MKRLFFLFLLCSQTVYALVDEGMVKNVLNMASSGYVTRTKDEISKPVQAVNMLAHELSLYKDEGKATNAAKSIIAMVLKGDGVGGLRKTGHKRRMLNKTEKQLASDAVKKAADYLRKQNLFDDVFNLLTPYDGEDGAIRKHDQKVRELLGETIAPDAHKYNAIEWKIIQEEQGKEEGGLDFTPQPVTDVFLGAIADQLETTLNTEKAYNLSRQLVESLKLSDTNLAFLEGEARSQLIRALVATEKFRMFETKRGDLDEKNPRVLDYTNDSQADAASQAILVALVSAIQNYLYNPDSTLEDLKRLFSYQANDRNLEGIEEVLKVLDLDELINQDLLDVLQKPVRINDLQKIEIDQENLKQRLRYYAMPVFNQETGEITYKPTFLRFYGSSGASNQCGFFSLGYESRQEAKDQILDNLKDPYIFVLADRISGTSGRIRGTMDRVLNEIEDRVKAALEEEMGDILNYPFDLGEEPDERKWDSRVKEVQEAEADIRAKIERESFGDGYDDESKELLVRYGRKIKFQGTYGDLRRQLIDVYRVQKDHINEEEKALDERIDTQKIDAGLPVSVPAEEEIAVWMAHYKDDGELGNLSKAEICNRTIAEREFLESYLNEIQKDFDEKIEFEVNRHGARSLNFRERNRLKGLISPEAWSEAEGIYAKISDQISTFSRQRREAGIAKINSRLTGLFYSLDDFRSIIERDLVALFRKVSIDRVEERSGDDSGQLLEFPPNPDWKVETPTYPLLMGILNNYNIGAWVSKSYLGELQSGRRGGANDEIQPVHTTEDEAYSLVNELYSNKTGKQVDLTNLWGGHFEKLVDAFDYARAARSLRHQAMYGLSNTRPRS